MPIKRLVEERRERRALAAGRHVAAAEVGHHGDPGQLRQQRRLAKLQGVAGAVEFLRPVPYGLAMGADRPDVGRLSPSLFEQFADDGGVLPHQFVAGQRRPVQLVGAASVQRQ